MNFIKKMKVRELIEMSLKCFASILAAFLAIILMEGMIYGIMLNGVYSTTSSTFNPSSTVVYAVKTSADEYDLIYKNLTEKWKDSDNDGVSDTKVDSYYTWSIKKNVPKEDVENGTYYKFYDRAPNAFELSITPIHFVVMGIFVTAVSGLFVYRFIRLVKSYKDLEEEYKKTGTIELPNL
ncbi:MAG: hypothetical protein IKC49_00085 [Clostridia bacterium]|nr:hypothetical protein [Clostridia bacterium]